MLVKWYSKFSKSGFSNTWTVNFQMFKLVLEKAEEPEFKLPTSAGSSKKQESSRKTSISALLTMPSLQLCGSEQIAENSERDWNSRTCDLPLRNLYVGQEVTVRNGHGTTAWFRLGKGVRQGCILSPCLFNLYASTSWETLGWKKHKLESRLPGEISITSGRQMIPPLWQKVKRN